MSEPVNPSVLRRMLSTPASQLDQLEMSPAKSLQIAVARGAEGFAGLTASVSEFREERLSLDGLVQSLEKPHLIHKLSTPSGINGLALWDSASVSALTEFLITGRMAAKPPEARHPTTTDAAVITGLLSRILEIFDQELLNVSDLPPVRGFRPSMTFNDARAVSMAFDEMAYRMYCITLDLGNGARTGVLKLVFPWEKKMAKSDAPSSSNSWKSDWHHNVKNSNVMVEAVLVRLSLTLEQMENLEIGSDIPVPLETITRVSVEGVDRKCVAVGRLGQSNGFRAVRIAIGSPATDQQSSNFSAAGTNKDVRELTPNVAPTPAPEIQGQKEPEEADREQASEDELTTKDENVRNSV